MTKVATAMANGSAREAALALAREVKGQLGGDKPALALVFASTAQPLGELMPALKAELGPVTLLGASTAGEFTEKGDAKSSAAVFAVAGDFQVHAGMAPDLKKDAERAVTTAAKSLPASVPGYPHRTAILLLDPLAGNSEEATLLAAAALGDDARLAGGAAGDDLHMKATQVGLNERTATDAIVLAAVFSKAPLGVGVCHRHVPISEGLKVTRAEGNVVYEVDGRPAWDVWAERTRASAQKRGVEPTKLKPEELGGFLLRYEAGLATGKDYKIRAPLSRGPDGSISFACGIPQGSVIRITESEPDAQIDAAREAARRARAQMGGDKPAGAVVFDCICRDLILGEQFNKAVHSISEELGGVKIAGFETYGEIALDAGDMSGFHNTTTVVLSFPS